MVIYIAVCMHHDLGLSLKNCFFSKILLAVTSVTKLQLSSSGQFTLKIFFHSTRQSDTPVDTSLPDIILFFSSSFIS